MANYSIQLINILDSINDTKTVGLSESFLFKYDDVKYLVSVGHFKPIIKTLLNVTDKVQLRFTKENLWNELQLFNCPSDKYIQNAKIVKSYRTRFMEDDASVNMFMKGTKETFFNCGYEILNHNPIQKSIYQKIFLGKKDKVTVDDFKGLSGSPVFDDDSHLIGVFCKVKSIDDNLIGYVLPVIYLIKTIEKKDNSNMYYLDIKDMENTKLGKFEIQKNVLENSKIDYSIYYQPINSKIPLVIYFSFEGDSDKHIMCKNIKTNSSKKLEYLKYTNFDISQKINKKGGLFKLNTGLIVYLISNGMTIEYNKIISDYVTKLIKMNDVWIKFNDDNIIKI